METVPQYELLAGEAFKQHDGTFVYVNLDRAVIGGVDGPSDKEHTIGAGSFVLTVYDADDGGPNDVWVFEVFTDRAEAEEQYQGRIIETRDASPNYLREVWGD